MPFDCKNVYHVHIVSIYNFFGGGSVSPPLEPKSLRPQTPFCNGLPASQAA